MKDELADQLSTAHLKLKQMVIHLDHLDEVIDFGIGNQLSFIKTLIKITNYEIDIREQNMIHAMVKVGVFPHLKKMEDFDISFQPSINQQQIQDFLTLRFIREMSPFLKDDCFKTKRNLV